MPVTDHPIHQSTRISESFRYGCHNRVGAKVGYLAPDGYAMGSSGATREVQLSYVEHTMSVECRYDMSLTDPGCDGCRNRGNGEAYNINVRSASATHA